MLIGRKKPSCRGIAEAIRLPVGILGLLFMQSFFTDQRLFGQDEPRLPTSQEPTSQEVELGSQSGQSGPRSPSNQREPTDEREAGAGDLRFRESGAILDQEGSQLMEGIESALVSVIQRCERSVVAITRVRKDQAARSQLEGLRLSPALQWQDDPTSEDFIPTFFGSGIVITADGMIVTCAHVLDDPRKHDYYVWLDRRCYSAEPVGLSAQVQAADPFSDLAVLRVDAVDLAPLSLAAEPVKKGQLVISLGNPFAIARDGRASASWGIVANVERFAPREKERSLAESIHQLGTLIQTDFRQPIGSSGGALVNGRGELVGMMTNLLPARGFEEPAGFAIATDRLFERVVESLKQGKQPEYGFLGIQPENLPRLDLARGLSGARVSLVIPGLPGSLAGLREGDIIFQVEDTLIGNRNDLFRELSRQPTGGRVRLKAYRNARVTPGQIVQMEAELAKKYVATSRPGFSLHGPAVWRGLQVEYQSAIAGELERIATLRDGPKVALLNVVPDSPAWQAGLRAGFGVISVNGRLVRTPEQFHQIVSELIGEVTLQVLSGEGRTRTAIVASE
jgi:serine protease Do